MREAHSSVPSIAVIDNAQHDTFTRARPIYRHKSLETKTYPRGHANLPTPDRSASESEERDFARERANDGDDPARKRESARKQTRNHDTTAAAYVPHAHDCASRARTTHVHIHGGPCMVDRVRWSGTRDSAVARRRCESATRGESARKREGTTCTGRRENERPNGPEARGVLAWMTRHCRGARVPRNHTACTRVYTRTHAYAARREPAPARRYPLSVCPCPLGDLEMCVMKNARIIAGHSSVRNE